jgi:hypothetical protein
MEINWTIDSINNNTINWRLNGSDSIEVPGHIAPLILNASVYGQIENATDYSIDYVKSVIDSQVGIIAIPGSKVSRLESMVIDNLTKQKEEILSQYNTD